MVLWPLLSRSTASATKEMMQKSLRLASRRRASSPAAGGGRGGIRVAVVGSGPSGFYSAKYLLRSEEIAELVMVDRLPTPFGLVRFGVAPDHPEVKNVIDDFSAVADDERFRYLGNLTLAPKASGGESGDQKDAASGKATVSLGELQRHFDAVVLAYGADDDRKLGIPGEDIPGVLSARAFVNWYNGHPEFLHLTTPIVEALVRCPRAVILGHGNVALDCARILAKATAAPVSAGDDVFDEAVALAATDICSHAVDALRGVRESTGGLQGVVIAGRRGAAQASFTIKELRELTNLKTSRFRVDQAEFLRGETEASVSEVKGSRPKKRLYALMKENCWLDSGEDESKAKSLPEVSLRFLLLPESIEADDAGTASAVRFIPATLEGDAGAQRAVPVDTGEKIDVECGLVLTAIGWRSLAADSEVPFDEARCVVPTGKGGRVIAEAAQNSDDAPPFVKGLYAAGWLRRGPSGIIGTNISDGRDVAAAILEDSAEGLLRDGMKDQDIGGGDAVIAAIASRIEGVDSLVEWTGHLRIDAAEVAAGLSKVRLFASCSALCIKNLTQHQIHYVSIVILRASHEKKSSLSRNCCEYPKAPPSCHDPN